MTASNPALLQAVQALAWMMQGWMAILLASIVTLTVMFHLHGTEAESKAPRTVWTSRAIVRVCGGWLLLRNVRRHFPQLHATIFVGKTQPPATGLAKLKPWLIVTAGLLAMVLLTPSAHAQGAPLSVDIYDNIGAFYIQQAKSMEGILKPLAKQLFGTLTVISFALFFMRQQLMGNGDLPSLTGKFTFEIFKAGFFFWLIDVAPTYLMQFMGYFTDAGSKIGQTGTLSPSGIVVLGFDTCFRTFDAIGRMGWGDTAAFGLPLALCAIGILICFALVAILFLIRVIEMHLIIYGGVLLLGFGGISFTRDIPKNYLSYAISAGAQLFMVYVVVGLGMQMADSWPQTLSTSSTPDDILRQVCQLVVASMVFAALAWSIPKAAASLVNGAVSMGASDALAPAGAAAAGAAAGAAVATGGASTLASATKGAMQAAAAGTSLAAQQGASGVTAALKGLGHAGRAMTSEAGSALKAKTGLQPPSPHALDSRGRSVDNLGTRAANNLQAQAQAAQEAAASAPQAPKDDTSGEREQKADDQAKAPGPLSIEGSPGTAGGAATAVPPPPAGEPFKGERGSTGGGRRLSPPQLPPDTPPNSAVSIRTELDD
ncbi:P-type conjugative transfer protein TrbL (plasmid) [Xanthomonas arboricola]|uniref:P-type conjugative transfer protein TrbL n=1 Tax=Xanthomonas arboricola TaxID=56448 RepID=UPI002B31200C|nr:P-type conjugative transfer protein TrbL [Xanthomonas arboricola]